MNYTTDIPQGTIDPILADKKWYDLNNLGLGIKLFQLNANTITTPVNGYNAISMTGAVTRIQNGSIDLLDGVTNVSFLIGFKRGLATGTHYVLYFRSNLGVTFCYLRMEVSGLLRAGWVTGVNSINFLTVNRYDDNLEHCAVLQVDQTNKTLNLYTDLGEVLTSTNLLMVTPVNFNPGAASDSLVGNINTYASTFNPGVINDLLIFDSILTPAIANNVLSWEKKRIGI